MASLCFCKRKYFYHKEGNYLPMITTNFYLKSFCFWTEDSFLQLLFEDHILHISQWNYGSCFQKLKIKEFHIIFVCDSPHISWTLCLSWCWNISQSHFLKLHHFLKTQTTRRFTFVSIKQTFKKSCSCVFFSFFSSHKIC